MSRNVSKTALVVAAPVAPIALPDAQAALRALIERSPDAAKAIALLSVSSPARTRTPRVAKEAEPKNETDRACEAAGMQKGSARRSLFSALIAKGPGTYSTSELAKACGQELFRVRADLQTVANRLADIERFPDIGYSLSFVEGKRGIEQTVMFAKVEKATS